MSIEGYTVISVIYISLAYCMARYESEQSSYYTFKDCIFSYLLFGWWIYTSNTIYYFFKLIIKLAYKVDRWLK